MIRSNLRSGLLPAVLLVAAAPHGALAQSAIGVIGGLSRATFSGGGAVDVTRRTTFLVGAVAELSVNERLAIRPELHFSAKGARVSTQAGDPADGPVKVFGLRYIQMPILAQLQTAGDSSARPRLFGGLSVGALFACTFGSRDCADIEEIDQRGLDFGAVAGVEVTWQRLGLGARYETGVRAVEASTIGNEIYNGVVSFTVRYMFRG